MLFERLTIPDLVLISPKKFGDARGYFMETFRQDVFNQNVGAVRFVQDNKSFSAEAGTVRGLHFQLPPKAQGKLISCVAGALLDVAVDIRRNSPTYGRHVAIKLTAQNGTQLWIPPGFAHGFSTLTANTEISYKVTDYYSAEHDQGLLWNDPSLSIDWLVDAHRVVLSEKDKRQPVLKDLPHAFTYEP